jgi:hypothetical protein
MLFIANLSLYLEFPRGTFASILNDNEKGSTSKNLSQIYTSRVGEQNQVRPAKIEGFSYAPARP